MGGKNQIIESGLRIKKDTQKSNSSESSLNIVMATKTKPKTKKVQFVLDKEIDLTPQTDKKYICSSAHRRKQPDKSRWTITIDQEVGCFVSSVTFKWIETSMAWGLISHGNVLLILGINSQGVSLKVAKFVDSNGNNLWHGYPADYVRNYQDRPGVAILKDWRTKGMIEKHHIIKIRQGKECNL
jgi:hypothetical protein